MGKDEGTQIAATAAQHKFVSPSPVLSTSAKGVSELSRFLKIGWHPFKFVMAGYKCYILRHKPIAFFFMAVYIVSIFSHKNIKGMAQ
jgi:hypothetical protein